ncbi:MAG TPA: hypothetical protein VI873_03175 [Candidatus Peribacteraceae bacterium]|nr:hypothetical protein [Candidatus Peribacteraceae bacterium]
MRLSFFLIFALLMPSSSLAAGARLEVYIEPLIASITIARGAQRVPVLNLNMKASCDSAVSVESITVVHAGKGPESDILRIYALENGKRVSNTTTIDSDQTATLRFRSFSIPACKTKSLTFAVDISPDAAGLTQHQFMIELLTDIMTDAEVLGELDGLSSFTLAPNSFGTINVEYLDLPRIVRYGNARIISRIRLVADRRDDHTISAITFINEGSARDRDLQNLALVSSRGEVLSMIAPQLSGESVRLVFRNPLRLSKNDDVVLSVRANVMASRRKTIQLLVETPGDIESAVRRGR